MQYVKKRQIIIFQNLVVKALRIFSNEGYIPTMNKSSIDRIIGLPKNINKILRKRKIYLFLDLQLMNQLKLFLI